MQRKHVVSHDRDWPLDEIGGLCRKSQVSALALFGSAARGEARPDRGALCGVADPICQVARRA